ncbi:MAG: RNA polymerase sporulation sigma factor SigH [Actinomycetota bacterium]|nr:RNA polymerase sporulation sigma factor SigH [Actinomycetota bacterium]
MALRRGGPPLTERSDLELVLGFRRGEPGALQALLERHRRLARAKARDYFLLGADSDDLEQEGMIGLFKAARDFQPDRQSSFRAFAELCITRQVITAIKTARRQKHQPLNQYVSLSPCRHGDHSVEDLLEAHQAADPVDTVLSKERLAAMSASMGGRLSGLEVDVLRLYVEGKSYQEIGDQLGRHTKSIDNALQRIKRKLDAHLQAEAEADLLVVA